MKKYVFTYCSKITIKYEKRYSSYELEGLAALLAIKSRDATYMAKKPYYTLIMVHYHT